MQKVMPTPKPSPPSSRPSLSAPSSTRQPSTAPPVVSPASPPRGIWGGATGAAERHSKRGNIVRAKKALAVKCKNDAKRKEEETSALKKRAGEMLDDHNRLARLNLSLEKIAQERRTKNQRLTQCLRQVARKSKDGGRFYSSAMVAWNAAHELRVQYMDDSTHADDPTRISTNHPTLISTHNDSYKQLHTKSLKAYHEMQRAGLLAEDTAAEVDTIDRELSATVQEVIALCRNKQLVQQHARDTLLPPSGVSLSERLM
jgi:hypothetical protein